MYAICISNKGDILPESYLDKTSYSKNHVFPLVIGKEHYIYGINYHKTMCHYLVTLNSYFYPAWLPAELFKIDNNMLLTSPFYVSYQSSRSILILCGYQEILNSTHHDNLLEREKYDLELFKHRAQQLDINNMVPWHWKRRALQTKQGLTMKAQCIANKAEVLSFEQQQSLNFEPTTSFNLTIGNKYILYGMHAYKNTVFYLLIGDNPTLPCLYPADLFELIDHLLPIEWYFNVTQQNGALWGYKELITNPDHLDRLLRQDPDALALFNMRKQEVDEWECLS